MSGSHHAVNVDIHTCTFHCWWHARCGDCCLQHKIALNCKPCIIATGTWPVKSKAKNQDVAENSIIAKMASLSSVPLDTKCLLLYIYVCSQCLYQVSTSHFWLLDYLWCHKLGHVSSDHRRINTFLQWVRKQTSQAQHILPSTHSEGQHSHLRTGLP